MRRTSKLSLLLTITLLLQLSLGGWYNGPQQVSAATAGPQIISLSPADDLMNVPVSTSLQITFDERVAKGASHTSITIYKSATNEVFESFTMSSSRVQVASSGTSVQIVPSSSFALNTSYYVLIDSGAFVNVSNGASFAGITSATAWNFNTVAVVDTTPPGLVSKQPEGNTVDITAPIVLNFNEPVYAVSGMIELQNAEDARSISVTSSAVSGIGSQTITIRPPAALQPNSTYTVVIPSQAFQDASGNKTGYISWSFKTGLAPVNMISQSPPDNKTSVAVNTVLTASFDTAVQARSGKFIEIRRVSNNTTFERIEATSWRVAVNGANVTITPSSHLEANTAYYVLIDAGAFTQLDPNGDKWYHGISGASVWNFTTDHGNETSNPVVSVLSPTNGGVVGELSRKLEITFNEKVYPNSGTIEIRESASGALFRSIPVTSTRVTGGGSTKIVIDANSAISGESVKEFVNNTKYYVTITNRAFRDEAGNFYAGITGQNVWTFTVTKDTTRPTVSLLSPLNNATTVSENARFTATFSEPVVKGSGAITIYKVDATAPAQIATSFHVNPSNNHQVIIVPNTPLERSATYYIYIDSNAVTDIVGNRFAGILNEHEWTFKTVGSDVTPPALSRAESNGSTITLTYNEELNPNLYPSAGSFYVSVNGATRSVSGVQVKGDSVYLTLSSPVVNGQTVRVSYTKPSTGLIQDVSGNQAPSFSNFEVKNAADATPPTVVGGNASGSTVNLQFSKEIASANSYAYLQFIVYVNGTAYAPTSNASSGNLLMLTINGNIRSYDSIYVKYTQGQYPIRDLAGNYLASFNSHYVSTTGSQSLSLQSATASGSQVSLKYNNYLSTMSIPAVSQYTVMVDNVARPISSVRISGDSVLLSLSTSITSSQAVYVSYNASGTLLMDTSGNTAPSFSYVLANGSGTGTGGGGNTGGSSGSLSGVIVKGSMMTLSFNQTLNTSYIPSSLQFLVKVNNVTRVVSMVSMTSTSVNLTLASPVTANDTVTVTYYAAQAGLRTTGGQTVNGFVDIPVGNQTSILDGVVGDYDASEGGGIQLKTNTAVTTADTSPAGVSAYRYTLLSTNVTNAFQALRNAGMKNPRVAFKVPSYEKAAIVAIPISALEAAYKAGGDGVFAVQLEDITYELSLKQLDFNALALLLNGVSTNGYVLVEIDQGSVGLTSSLSAAISSASASIVAGPAHMQVSVTNGTIERKVTEFKGYMPRTITTNKAVTYGSSAVVWLDPVTGTLSYVPTTFKSAIGGTTATFSRKANSAYALVSRTSTFTDVNNHWAANTINSMYRKFIVEARSGTQFMPDQSITRGEFATYIAKGLGLSGNKTAAAKFSDVNSSTVMGAYIGAASSAGIVLGNTDGTFRPNSLITRQEMAAMMVRAATAAGVSIDMPQSNAAYLQVYTDRGSISSWAQTDVAKAIYIGVINGKTSTTISPTTNATRAEGTVMLNRLLVFLNFLSE